MSGRPSASARTTRFADTEPTARGAGTLAADTTDGEPARRRARGGRRGRRPDPRSTRPTELSRPRAKSSATDHVTQMDRASEALIREIIASRRPRRSDRRARRRVERDRSMPRSPGSSTRSTARPTTSTTTRGTPSRSPPRSTESARVGVVADPTHGRTYRAVAGRRRSCNDRPIRLGPAAVGRRARSSPPVRLRRRASRVARARSWPGLLPLVRDIRRMGAAAIDLCSVAVRPGRRLLRVGAVGLGPRRRRLDRRGGGRPARCTRRRARSTRIGPRRPPRLFDPLLDLLRRRTRCVTQAEVDQSRSSTSAERE